MITKYIEAAHPVTEQMPHGGNHGKFMIARFDAEDWAYKSALPGFEVPLLIHRGWSSRHFLFVDLQTGEGAILNAPGSASADLNKHRIWVCPLAEPFLEWLYQQDLSDITKLPAYVELPNAPLALAGHRRQGTAIGDRLSSYVIKRQGLTPDQRKLILAVMADFEFEVLGQ